MKSVTSTRRISLLFLLTCLLCSVGHSQIQMPLLPHASNYSGMARGYWFISPMAITITGLMVAPEAGTGLQYIHLMKTHDPMPIAFTTPSTNFTTLNYVSGAPNNTVVPVNISIQAGDTLLIIGTAGTANSYTASSSHTSTIGSHTVTLGRAGTQASITGGPALNYWGFDPLTNFTLGRVFIYYQMASPTDAGLQSFVFPVDTICEGNNDVVVRLKNHGPNTLHSVDIEWEVNSTPQTSYNWTGSLAINDSDDVTIGSFPFQHAVSYSLTAFTSTPNYAADTINNLNDTVHLQDIFVSPAPGITLNDTVVSICQGDTAIISGTLTGTPPWDLIVSDGTTNIPVTNITNPLFAIAVTPASTKTYSITSISDATGCDNTSAPSVTVAVQAAPPAVITPLASTAACAGDSVILMASIGLNFSYAWLKDGVVLPGDTTYVLAVKTGGDYTVRVSSPIGCSSLSAPVTVTIHPLPSVFLGNDTAVPPGTTLLLNAGPGFNSYLWSTGATSQSIVVDSSGTGIGVKTVWVHVTDNYYCLGGDTMLINFTNHPGINEAFANAEITVIPNPSDGRIELHLANIPAGAYDIEVFSPDGKLIYRSKHQLSNNKIILDLSHLANGVYVLKVTGRAGTVAERIVIRN